MNYNLEIQKILLKVEKHSNPDDKINLLKQAISIADANNDLDWGFDLRLDLIAKEIDTSHCTDSFPAFAWILNTRDNNPDLFEEDDFLWEYKWMTSAARRNAGIAREQVESIMDDLRERMQRNGYTDRAYYNIKFYWHLFCGEYDEARKYIQLRDDTPRDRMSHCIACELDSRVELELINGNFDKAITLAHDLITEKLTCGRLPFATFSNLAYYLGKAGHERANDFYKMAVKEIEKIENDTSFLCDLSQVIQYAALNDHVQAWKLFEKHAEWELGSEDALCFDFSLAVLLLCKKENGIYTLHLSPKLPYYRSDNTYNTKELYDYYYTKAKDLADRFDVRHGNDHFTNRLNAIINA